VLQKTAKPLSAQGKTVIDVCYVIEVTPNYQRRLQQCGGMQAGEARCLTQREKDNARIFLRLSEGVEAPCRGSAGESNAQRSCQGNF